MRVLRCDIMERESLEKLEALRPHSSLAPPAQQQSSERLSGAAETSRAELEKCSTSP